VLHNGALGDCVFALHFAAAAKAALGARHLIVAARSPIARWAARRELIDEALFLDELQAHRWYAQSDHAPDPFLKRFDAIVSLLAGPDEPVTLRLRELCEGPVFAVEPGHAASGVHIVRQWAAQLSDAGIEMTISDTGAFPTMQGREALLDNDCGLVLCHPGSGGTSKCCPLEPLERIVADLRRADRAAAWMTGPDEMERDGPALLERLKRTAPVIFRESVEDAADVVFSASAFIGNDAGMTHVAALCGIKTIALFGPTDPRVWRPLGKQCRTMAFGDAASVVEAPS
jgi:hypothetical protein